VNLAPEAELTDLEREARLDLYCDSNDAFRNLLLGKYGKLPLGFPADWVYQSAFGSEWQDAIASRTEASPLETLQDMDLKTEEQTLEVRLGRKPTAEEFVIYLNHPGDALKTIEFCERFGDANNLPVDVWFEGLEKNEKLLFQSASGKPHVMRIDDISEPDEQGLSMVRYTVDNESVSYQVKVREGVASERDSVEMADHKNPYHIASPSNGDLWVMHVRAGDHVKLGEEICNISIMKQEKSVYAPTAGLVKRVLKNANYQEDKIMVPVKEGELLVELGPVEGCCPTCKAPVSSGDFKFCPGCGQKL